MRQGTIAGPFDPLYPEVVLKLRDDVKHYPARWVYIVLVSLFPVEEDWDTDDPVWVAGIIRANKIDIARESGVGWKGFSKYWKELLEAGLIQETEDGLFIIPYYKKRAYDSISAREMRERLSRLEKIVTINGSSPEEHSSEKDDYPRNDDDCHPLTEDDHPLTEDDRPLTEDDRHPLTEDDHPLTEDDHPLTEDSKAPAIIIGGYKEETEEEEEVGGVEPGSRKWIIGQADQLWPGRGFRPETDAGYIEELEKFDVAELEAAFERALADKARYGNFSYLLNYLRKPSLYNKTPKTKGEGAQQKKKLEHDPNIGRLIAPWLDDE